MPVLRRSAGQRATVSLRAVPFVCGDDKARHPSKWRVAGALPLLDLTVVEGLAVAQDQSPYHRVFRLMGLQIADAATLLPTGSANHLVQQLERALGGARIAVAEPQSGVDGSHQIGLGKMGALGQGLGGDHEMEPPGRHVVKFLSQTLDGLYEVARKHEYARLRKELGRFRFKTLDARPHRSKALGGVAIRAFR